jgi:hypothetical protein
MKVKKIIQKGEKEMTNEDYKKLFIQPVKDLMYANVLQARWERSQKEATVWSTHRLKKSEIKIMTKCDRSTAAQYREEILSDILSREPNPSKKSSSSKDEVHQRRKAS